MAPVEEPEGDGGWDRELAAPLRGLAALLPESADFASEIALAAIKGLTSGEAAAIRQFELDAQKCLAKMTGHTIHNLQRLCAGGRGIAKTRTDKRAPAEAESRKGDTRESVYELFEKFDTNKDGVLTLDEFREAFRALAGNKFEDEQMETLLQAADVNRDGAIDIHEFTVWLYGSASGREKPEAEKAKPEAAKEEAEKDEGPDLKVRLDQLETELIVKNRAISRMEEAHEEEMEATHDFWREVAKHAVLTIDKKVDLENSEWLGNGKYGFVLKAKRREDKREVVVKMMGVRWAHLAVKEWQHGSSVGKHPNIVEYEEVMLHADNDMEVGKLLKSGYDTGKLKSRVRRKSFPDRFICLTQEFMNRGTVQDWMDKEYLKPGGMLFVAKEVACGLAHMHKGGVTHNDIKPENVMLHEDEHGKVFVKLGDLGLAKKSKDRHADFWQYGMTLLCMATGEKFGSRKYTPEASDGFVEEAVKTFEEAEVKAGLKAALQEVPRIMKSVFAEQVDMKDIAAEECLQEWSMYDGDQTERVHTLVKSLTAKSIMDAGSRCRSKSPRPPDKVERSRSSGSTLEE